MKDKDLASLLNGITDFIEKRNQKYIQETSLIKDQEVKAISIDSGFNTKDSNKLVFIYPCEEELKDKAFLGIYLGDLGINRYVEYEIETSTLHVRSHNNPAIFVPILGKIIYGMESWWGLLNKEHFEKIKNTISEEQLNLPIFKTHLEELNNG